MGEDTKYCGNCKREVSASNFTVHTVHCQRNIAVCTQCNEAVPRTRYQQHVETNHKSVPCSKCGAEVEPLQTFSHEKEECPRRQVACHLCELEVAAAELARHVEYCGARTERCKGCSKYVQSKYLQFHYEHDHKYLRPEEKADRNGSDDEGAEECPICLGPVTLPLALECGHTFCMVCVKGIANTTKNCAICRRDIPRDMLMDIRFCREEDIIKHYVNKPRTKKNTRSHSVPSRSSSSSSSSYTGSSSSSSSTRRLVHHTTQEYDDMVSALLSSRTSSTSYRYQRPSNTHTPPSYTPYSSSTNSNSTTTNTTSTSSCQDSCNDSCKDSEELGRDDDCCCSSLSSSTTTAVASTSTTSSSSTTTTSTAASSTTTTSSAPSSSSSSPSSPSTATNTTTTTTCKPSSAVSSTSSSSSSSASRTRATTAATTTTTTTSASNSKSSSASARSSSASVRSGTNASSANTRTVSSVTTRSSATTESTSSTSATATITSSSSTTSSSSSSSSSTSSYSNGARPRRPTSLALETISVLSELSSSVTSPNGSASGSSRSSAPKNTEPPKNATQEEYDRWLAFQLAKAEDDLPPAEFNRKHRPTFRRSLSMPERAGASSDSSSSSDSEDSDTPSSRKSSRRPPASPRNTTASSSSSSSTSSSTSSSSTRSTPISKSSSDSSAATSSSSSGSALSTGARPKNTSLRKRVSFKEDAPPVRRQAPVMLPCEFCDEMFSERDLMRHQTSCEQNETQLPRTSRLAQRTAAAAATSSTTAASSSSSVSATVTATSSSRVTSVTSSTSVTSQSTSSGPPRSPGPASPAQRRTPGRTPTPVCTPPRKSTAPNPASVPPKPTDSGSSGNRKSPAPVPPRNPASPSRRSPTPASLRSATTSPLPRCPPSLSPTPVSSPVTTTITIVDKPPCVVVSPSLSSGSSRPFSVSPAPCGSTSNSSVSSGSVSGSSVSTTPSTSSSASPVPSATPNRDSSFPNTPTTDVELDYDEEDGPYMRPRRGRLLSSAIFSWRSISASGAASRRGYVRSNTAPLEDTGVDDETQPSQPVTTSRSATQLPASSHSPVPDTTTTSSSSSSPEHTKTSQMKQISATPKPAPVQDHAEPVFIKNPNKYRAPPPPQSPPKTAPSSPPPQKPSTTSSSSASHAHMNGHVKSPQPQEIILPGKTVSSHEKQQVNSHVNGFIKLDSKPMMNGHTSKEVEELIPCEFCKQVYPPNKFQSHQTMCETTHQPPVLRPTSPLDLSAPQKAKSSIPAKHNKGPAPPPPEDTAQKTSGSDTSRAFSPVRHRMERSQSVLDDRISYSEKIRVNRRLERASSISRSYYTSSPSPGRRWSSREVLHSNSLESSTSYASSGWSGSTSNILCGGGGGYASTHGWSSHVNMVRDDVRSRAAAATAAAAAATAAYYGGLRYRDRSSSRPRPSSMYSTSDTWGSMFDLHSPSRHYNISDAFSSASLACKKRYIR